jgi:hypothetical protein
MYKIDKESDATKVKQLYFFERRKEYTWNPYTKPTQPVTNG